MVDLFFEGLTHSIETKEKMSILRKGKIKTDEHKKRISESIKKSITSEQRIKRSIQTSGKNNPMFGVIGKEHPMFGKHHSEDTKELIRLKFKEYMH